MAEVYSVVLVKKAARGRCNTGICSACCGFLKLLSRQRKNSEMAL